MKINALLQPADSSASQAERRTTTQVPSSDFDAELKRKRQENADAIAPSPGNDAPMLRDLMSSFMDGAGADGKITWDEILSFRDKHAKESKDILNTTMSELGINRSAKLKIDSDPYGHILVSGSNLSEDDRDRLEQALNSNKAFQHSYSATAGTSCLIESAKYSTEFSKAYEKNPKEAVARFAWLFGAKWHCTMTYDQGAMDFSVGILP